MSLQNKILPNWIMIAIIQKALGTARLVNTYNFLQRRIGRLGQFHPGMRAEYAAKLYLDVQPVLPICGASFVEIGTGWVPVVPIGLYLLGAGSIDTYDTINHLQKDITLHSVRQYEECLEELHQISGVSRDDIRFRYETIKHVNHINTLFEICGIRYHAPHDFAKSGLKNESIDVFYSNLVLEHLRASVLKEIHQEALRVLKNEGVCWHNVDCTDHYSQYDPSISRINFLKYGKKQWERWGQNDFLYQNRIRMTQYYKIFKELGFDVIYDLKYTSDDVRHALNRNFPLHHDFSNLSADDIATTAFRVVLKKQFAFAACAQSVPKSASNR